MLKIKNTLTKKKEKFISIEKNKIRFYQCGPTVYWNQHIGNMRSVVLADFINRSLQYLKYKVNFVRNYTDVGHLTSDSDLGEDKMEKASKREKISPKKIAQKYINIYEGDIKKLNVLFPKSCPKATDYILEQIKMIKKLLKNNFAYVTPLAIYFDTSKVKNYYKLSGQNKNKNILNAGSGEKRDFNKKNNEDFALWFFKAGNHKNDLQTWNSPFSSSLIKNGRGSPGWHLECSAMAKSLLGNTLDIKMGGIEHVPIHHTNEIAQSENANKAKYVNYWLHNEHLLVNNKKMSKSEGSSFLISDIEKKGYSAFDLRYFFIQAHYRSKQNFTWKALEASKISHEKLINKLRILPNKGKINENFQKNFIKKIEDDFSIPETLALIFKILKSKIPDADKKTTILNFDKILGLNLKKEIKKEKKTRLPKNILNKIEQREKFRQQKNWKKSDKLREEIFKLGWEILDTHEGWRIKKIK